MTKKQKAELYKQGMEAGAKPFQEKFEQTTQQLRETSQSVANVARNQRKNQSVVNQMIDGVQKLESDLKQTQQISVQNEKQSRKQEEAIKSMELLMPKITAVCNFCGRPVNPYQIVCSHCGKLGEVFPYDLEKFDIQDKCLSELDSLSVTVSKNCSREEEWLYPELDEKFIKMKKIQEIAYKSMNDEERVNTNVYEQIYYFTQKFFDEYQKKKIEIAVVGTVKAGKSSLINALLGASLASVDPTPETSILVRYRTTGEGNYLRIKFYTEEEWAKLWNTTKGATVFLSEYKKSGAEAIKQQYLGMEEKYISCSSEELPQIMMEWSKSDAPRHFFVKEIEVGYQSDALPHDIFLVDTPGLSDPVRYRSDITRAYIKKSDWILACITSEKLSEQPEFHFLSKVIENKNGDVSKIFVVATKKDMLSQKERDAKGNEFLQRLGQLYKSKSKASSRFSFVAAECHVFARKVIMGEELTEDEDIKWWKMLADMRMSPAEFTEKSDEVIKYAGVEDLFAKINRIVLSKRRSILITDITEDYFQYMSMINALANDFIEDRREMLEELISRRETDTNRIEEIRESNKELEILQTKVQALKKQLEIEIAANGTNTVRREE